MNRDGDGPRDTVARSRRTGVTTDAGTGSGGSDLVAESAQERTLQAAAEGQEIGVPFPVIIGAGEGSVVKLVTTSERELRVVVAQDVDVFAG